MTGSTASDTATAPIQGKEREPYFVIHRLGCVPLDDPAADQRITYRQDAGRYDKLRPVVV